MPREYAKFRIDTWADEDFRQLPLGPQHLYLYLLAAPSMNYCGVSDWRPGRIAVSVAGWAAEDVRQAAKVLVDRLFVVIDEETEEILVRSFLRHDGVMKEARLAVSMVKAYTGVTSATLRGVIVHELKRLYRDHPDWSGWMTVSKKPGVALELLHKTAVDPATLADVSPPLGQALPVASPAFGPNAGPGLPVVSGSTSPSPTTAPADVRGDGRAAREPAPRNLPLPDGWWPGKDAWSWAEEARPDVDLVQCTQAFAMDRRARGVTRADWSAEWKGWVLKEFPGENSADSRAARAADKTIHHEMPDWCGDCDEYDRWYENEAGAVAKCPRCHPDVAGRF